MHNLPLFLSHPACSDRSSLSEHPLSFVICHLPIVICQLPHTPLAPPQREAQALCRECVSPHLLLGVAAVYAGHASVPLLSGHLIGHGDISVLGGSVNYQF